MASTYSALKIQLMATGENSGTWGNVTNDNLGVALEEAIVGSADVTFASGNVTLTLTDTNASQTARNLRLNLTGTTGGARDLIVPAIEKLYIVNNGCADTVTIKVTGQTGIAVPAGKTLFVYNNGTDCVDAITHLTSLTLATALPVASGGTGSTTATFSGANITSLNASSISSGTIANARTTATNANGASTIVARDASGNFIAHDIQFDSFGVGTAASGTTGEIRATNNVTAFYSSDRKFKENIKPIEGALDKVMSIGGKTFDWTDAYITEHGGEDGYFVNKADFGVIAQDVQAVFPQAVRTRDDGSLAVDYEKLSALAFAAIKELSEKVKKLGG
jgi:hypothetical protein